MLSALTAAALKIFDKFLGGVAERAGKAFTNWWKRSSIAPASGQKIALLLARLDGDTEHGSVRESVREAIRRELVGAVEIVLWPEALRVDEAHGANAEAVAQITAQKWLLEKNSDLLIWGRVKSSNIVSLHFTVRGMIGPESSSYKLNDTLDLPLEFVADLGTAISASLMTLATLAAAMRGHFLLPLLRHIAERLQPLIGSINPRYDSDTRGNLLHTYALVRDAIGTQGASEEDLEKAVAAYQGTLQYWTRNRVPAAWAVVHNNLGNALTVLARMRADRQLLAEAITSYKNALEVFTREREPLDWANTQSNLGTAFQLLGKLDTGVRKLEESVACYREALIIRTRDLVPLDWAMTQNNLGNTLFLLSTREERVVRLQESIEAFLEALKERTRDRVPFEWAQTVSNLAQSLLLFAHLEGNPYRTEAAIDGLKQALAVFQQLGAERYITETQKSLVTAIEQLAKQRSTNEPPETGSQSS